MILDYLVYLVVRILICVAQAMRIETGEKIARLFAWLFYDVLRLRRRLIDENLRHAFPELSDLQRARIIRRMWRHLFLLVLEVAHAPRKIHETNWRHYVRLENKAPLVRALLDDRPTVIVTAHFGNFEVAGYVLGLLGFPTHTVARTLDNPFLDRFVNQFRGQTGQYIIPKNGGYEKIAKVMETNGTITLLADQHAGDKGCWIEFFGRPASAYKAIALLTLGDDAPLVITGARRLRQPLHFEMGMTAAADPRDMDDALGTVRGLTQWYNDRLEELIRRQPDQYWWLHRRWREPPKRVRRRLEKKAA